MNANVGSVDRAARVVIGLVLLSLLYFLEGNARWLGLVGVVLIATAVFRWCPAYALVGISSCKAKTAE